MDSTFLTLGSNASAPLRQAKSVNSAEADTKPELFDFASILGGLVGSAPEVAGAPPANSGSDLAVDDTDAFATSADRSDTSVADSLVDSGQPLSLPLVGSDGKPIADSRLSSERLSISNIAKLRGALRSPALGGAQMTSPQLLNLPGSNPPAATREQIEAANDVSSKHLQRLNLAGSLDSPDASHVAPHALADNASTTQSLAALVKSAVPSFMPPSVAISLASPPAPLSVTTRSRLSTQADTNLTVEADSSLMGVSHEPRPILTLGELLGVAGKLQFHDDHSSAQSPISANTPSSASQGALLQLPLSPGQNLPPQQLISTPLSAPQWPSVFSTSIVRLATEQISEANLTVTPDDLGTINIKIALEGNSVSLGFTAENSEVRQAVNASLPMLHDMFEKSGLSLSQSSVGQEAHREATPSPSPFRPQNDGQRESDTPSVSPTPPQRPHRPQLGAGRVDFFA